MTEIEKCKQEIERLKEIKHKIVAVANVKDEIEEGDKVALNSIEMQLNRLYRRIEELRENEGK